MLRIRIGDIKIGDEERKAVMDVLDIGRISEHTNVSKFEREWAKFIGTKYSIATSSGSSALLLGLQTLLIDERFPKIKRGSKVITSPLNYTATCNAIVLSGLEPVFVDIDRATFTLKTDQIEDLLKKSDEKYSIILPVHLMGYVNDMDEINRLAEKHNLVTFEDAAQAHGSKYKGRTSGTLSLLADYSFYIAHNIQAGEMGAIVTGDATIRNLAKKLKSNGRVCSCNICTRAEGKCPYLKDDFDPKFTHEYIGYNFKSTEFPAAIALCQLKKIDWILKRRRHNVKYLNIKLHKYSEILQLPLYSDDISYLAYPMVINMPEKISRQRMLLELEKRSIECRPLFGCVPTQQPSYRHLKHIYKGKLPTAEYIGENGFYIGCHQYLTDEDLDFIINVFDEVLKDI